MLSQRLEEALEAFKATGGDNPSAVTAWNDLIMACVHDWRDCLDSVAVKCINNMAFSIVLSLREMGRPLPKASQQVFQMLTGVTPEELEAGATQRCEELTALVIKSTQRKLRLVTPESDSDRKH